LKTQLQEQNMKYGYGTGFAPPPGQEKEEPDLWQEDDIPVDNRGSPAADEHERERPLADGPERE
jgi:hypothetical protein